MRLSYGLFLAAAALVATLDATSAASDVALTKPNMARAVTFAEAHKNIGNDHRILIMHKKDVGEEENELENELKQEEDDDDEEEDNDDEERMISGWKQKAIAAMTAMKFAGKSPDEISEVLNKLEPDEIIALYNQAESHVAKFLPGFHRNIDADDFVKLIKDLPSGMQGLLLSGYTKYHHLSGKPQW